MDNKTLDYVIASYKVELAEAKKLLNSAEIEVCPGCKGKGRIDPIENPPYICDICNGRGWISPYVNEDQDKKISRLREAIRLALDEFPPNPKLPLSVHVIEILTDALKEEK